MSPESQDAVKELGRQIDVLLYGHRRERPAAKMELLRLLPKLRPGDEKQLEQRQIEKLRSFVHPRRAYKDPEVAIAVLAAFERTGRWIEHSLARRLAGDPNPSIRNSALACIAS